jgi:hypothetical protein
VNRREGARAQRIVLLTALALIAAGLLVATSAQAAGPAWRVMGASGPTNLPPLQSETQELDVDAEGGTFTLSFGAQTTSTLAFNASPAEVQSALNALSNIGGAGGSVQVLGGPGSPGGESPYSVTFGGVLANQNVLQMTANSSGLTGGAAIIRTLVPGGSGTGEIAAYATNVGGGASTGTVTLIVGPLPLGLTAGAATGTGWSCATATSGGQDTVTCTRTASVAALKSAPPVLIPVTVTGATPLSTTVHMSVMGGGAAPDPEGHDAFELPLVVSAKPAKPGFAALWAGAFDENGQPEKRAGSHPYSSGTGFLLNTVRGAAGNVAPAGDLRELQVDLPPGFIGNPQLTKRCPQSQLLFVETAPSICTAESVVGEAPPIVSIFGEKAGFGIENLLYNDMPPEGYAAEFSFKVGATSQSLLGSVRSDEDFGVTLAVPNAVVAYKVFGSVAFVYGEPAGASGRSLLTNPTDCALEAEEAVGGSGPLATFRANTYSEVDSFYEKSVSQPAVTDCKELKFEPDFSFQPSGNDAASVTAGSAHLHIDQKRLLAPEGRAPPHLKKSVVTLPAGLILNPAAADGLAACSTAQIGLKTTTGAAPNPIRFTKEHPSCPDASKIGTAEIETPLLEDPLEGTVYLAAQEDNPFHSLLAMYLVVDDAKTGTVVKLPGKIEAGGQEGVEGLQKGQLRVTFDNNPQLPVEDLTLNIRGGGPRSALATPDVCAKYTTDGEWTPWSAPESGPPAQTTDSFEITKGVGGSSSCPKTKAERPFNLALSAGTTSSTAGAHSPFVLRLTRPDGNQELDKISVTTPPGFAATLKGVATCSWASVDAAAARSKGADEIAHPSCPASSQVGTTTIGAGVGSSPLYVKTGKVYLTGPYEGAPLSFTFIVPAVAGPFDLGVQVVKTALQFNSKTAQVTAVSDSIPQTLKGVPLQVRDVQVNIDRSNFTLNPTNCEPMAIAAKVTGGSGATANLSNRFQVGNCKALKFHPDLAIQLHGGTKRGDYQRLQATVTYPKGPGYANIARAAVTFPHSAFLAQEHIRTVCTRVQFAAHACPQGSIYGHAEATTPLLDGKLSGPVYLRSSDNLLPDLVVALRGPDNQPIEVELAGRTDSKHGGIRNTFDMVPDAPVSEFKLTLLGGKKSLIVNSRDLCKSTQRATVQLDAQNGKTRDFRPLVKNDCGKKHGHKSHKQHKRHASQRLAWRLGW